MRWETHTAIAAGLDTAVLIFSIFALDAVDDETREIPIQLFSQSGLLGRIEATAELTAVRFSRLDGTARSLGCFRDGCGRLARCLQFGCQCLDLVLALEKRYLEGLGFCLVFLAF